MSKPYPIEFGRDVVAVARKHEALLAQIAKEFRISDATLHNGMRTVDVEDGIVPDANDADAAEFHALKDCLRLLEQENEVLRRAGAYPCQAKLPEYRCTRRSVSRPPPTPRSGYRWRTYFRPGLLRAGLLSTLPDRAWEAAHPIDATVEALRGDPAFGYRDIAVELAEQASPPPNGGSGGCAPSGGCKASSPRSAGWTLGPDHRCTTISYSGTSPPRPRTRCGSSTPLSSA